MTETIIPAAPGAHATLIDAFMGVAHTSVTEIVAWRITDEGARPVFYEELGPDTLVLKHRIGGGFCELRGRMSFETLDEAKKFALELREVRVKQKASGMNVVLP